MSTPAATQPAPLSQQIAILQTFATAGMISHEPGAKTMSPIDAEIDEEQLGVAWNELKEVVFGNDVPSAVRSSWRNDALGYFAETTFPLAQKRIGSRLESLAKEQVSRAVLDREGVDPFNLEQYTEDGLLLVEPVRAFNLSAAQYLQKRLDYVRNKLGDFILSAARVYYSGAAGPLLGLKVSAKLFFEVVESETEVHIEQARNEPPHISLKYPGMSFARVDQGEFFREALFPWCEKALRILVAGDLQLRHEDFFELPLLVRSDIGLIQALYRAGMMDVRVIGAFLTKLNIMKKRPDGLAIL